MAKEKTIGPGRKAGLKNLKPFKKGKDERRNGNGRPKKLPALDALMAEVLGAEKNGKSAAQQILDKLLEKARAGDIRAAEVLLDRGYGKAKETIDLTNKVITVRVPDEDTQSNIDPFF